MSSAIVPFQFPANTADPTFFRTYSRLNPDGSRESWEDTTDRTTAGLVKLGDLTEAETQLIRSQQLMLHAMVSGRWLWVGGTPWSEQAVNYSGTYNCAGWRIESFERMAFMMNLLMQGCGVGTLGDRECLDKLPPIACKLELEIVGTPGDLERIEKTAEKLSVEDGDLIVITINVGDSRQGWVDAYQAVLELAAHTETPVCKLIIQLGHIRAEGQKIKGFGGVTNPAGLPRMFEQMVKILNKAVGRKLNSLEVFLLMDEAAAAVVAGGVRRSACIRQGDNDDQIFITAKDNLWSQDADGKWKIDPDRDALRMSNHTRVFHHKPTLEECIAAVSKQYYSGEGAIQWAGEAVARSNVDLIANKVDFLKHYNISRESAKTYLYDCGIEAGYFMDEAELSHRMGRFLMNPCFAAGTMVLTRDGHSPIESLVGKTVEIWDGNEWVKVDNFRVTGTLKEVFKVELSHGESVVATPYHEFILSNGERKELRDLVVGDKLKTHNIYPDNSQRVNCSQHSILVTSIEDAGIANQVYCCTVPTTGQFALSYNIQVSNCGEIIGENFACNLGEVHLNLLNPYNLIEQDTAFRAAALSVSVLLNHKFVDAQQQYSRELDPIVGVSFTGLFDFFVHAFGVDWLQWWEQGRELDFQISETGWTKCCRVAKLFEIEICKPMTDRDDDRFYHEGEIYRALESAYLNSWRVEVEGTVKDYCYRHNLKAPNRCTTVQPSGSKSLLTGASPGFHPPKAVTYLRRMTFRRNDPVALACIDFGYTVIPSQSDKDENGNLLDNPYDDRCTEWLVEIPVAVSWAGLPGVDSIDISQFSALAQMDFYLGVQTKYTKHNCFSRGTKFLTDRGIRSFENFEENNFVNVLNKDGDWSRSRIVKTNDIRQMYDIEIKQGKTGNIKHIVATGCHRFPIKRASAGDSPTKVVTTLDLKPGHRLINNWADLPKVDLTGIQHGICFGDGSLYKAKQIPKGCQLYLCGKKRHLKSYFTEYVRCYEKDQIDQTRIYGLPVHYKLLPDNNCSQAYLAGFIAGLLATDGNIHKSVISFSTISMEAVQFLEAQLPRLGSKVSSYAWHETNGYKENGGAYVINVCKSSFPENLILRPHHLQHFNSAQSQPCQWKVVSITETTSDYGWCVIEPDTHHFTLSDNILTMNTSATIELREHEIEPLATRIYQAIQNDEGYISAALLARFDDIQTFPRLPFEPISKATFLELTAGVLRRRMSDNFGQLLAKYDRGDTAESGPAGCDSDKCLLPERKP